MKKPLGFALACVMILTSVLPAVAAGTNQTRQPDDNLPLYTQGRSHSYDEGIVDGGVYRIRDIFCGGYLQVSSNAQITVNDALSNRNSQFFGFLIGKIKIDNGTKNCETKQYYDFISGEVINK